MQLFSEATAQLQESAKIFQTQQLEISELRKELLETQQSLANTQQLLTETPPTE
mgnify:CR=1 FL=1